MSRPPHHRHNLSATSIPFVSPYGSTTSLEDESPEEVVTPSIRERKFGQTLGLRTTFQGSIGSEPTNGLPDLFHWGRCFSTRSSQYLNHDFSADENKLDQRDDDGYVGFYHYANGLDFTSGISAIEAYICSIVGIKRTEEVYNWKRDMTSEFSSKKEMVVTFCLYNIFAKAELRTRYILYLTGFNTKNPINIDKSFHIIPDLQGSRIRKSCSFTVDTVLEIQPLFWQELTASLIIRLFNHLDNPANQLTGLVSFPHHLRSNEAIQNAIRTLIPFLPRGLMTPCPATYGKPTGCNNKDNKINFYNNSLTDALIRLCQFEPSGAVAQFAADQIAIQYGLSDENWKVIVLRLLSLHNNSVLENQFVIDLHQSLTGSGLLTTTGALLLQEQIRYLISKGNYDTALLMAQKGVEILPLDFESWYSLVVCYILQKKFSKALLILNNIPLITNQKQGHLDDICGVRDFFSTTFIGRLATRSEPISEQTFKAYFPTPQVKLSSYSRLLAQNHKKGDRLVEEGSISKLWNDYFLFNPQSRHPFNGYQFYQSPLMNCSARTLSTVDSNLTKVTGPAASKIALSAQSAGIPSLSILNFETISTWGRCYDLLTMMVAVDGWDNLVRRKESLFISSALLSTDFVVGELEGSNLVACSPWLDKMFFVLYEDLRTLMTLSHRNREQQHSALEWEMMGLLGWSIKYNLKESISALITSVIATSANGDFDYFATVKLLAIYYELVLSENSMGDSYTHEVYSRKLILQLYGNAYEVFVSDLEENYLTLDFVLLIILKLVSWNLRWYQYIPNHLITKVINGLCNKHDSVYIRSKMRVVFEQNKKSTKARGMFSTASKDNFEFVEDDTIVDYCERLINWLEDLRHT